MRAQKGKRHIRSIKIQMLFIIMLIIVTLTVGIISFVSIILSEKYDDEINFNNETVTNLISSNLENFLGKAYGITEELALNAEIVGWVPDKQEKVLKSCAERNAFVELLFVQGADGMQTARSSGECGDRFDRWWFSMVTNDGKSFISKSYLSATNNTAVSSIFMPIRDNGEIIGSIGMDIRLDYIQELIEANSDAQSGRYSFVMDGEGVVLAHPQSEYVAQMYNFAAGTKQNNGKEEPLEVSGHYQQIAKEVLGGSTGSMYFQEGKDGYYCAYTPINLPGDSPDWSIVTIQDEQTAKSIITSIVRTSSTAAAVLLIVSLAVIYITASSIANPIRKISGLLSQAASGDFTVRFHTRSKSEIGLLAESFNEMLSKISDLLRETKQITGDVSESILLLDEKSAGATEKADSIKTSANEILTGSTEQAWDAERSAGMSAEMSRQFEELSGHTVRMVEDAKNASEVTASGVGTVAELRQKNQVTYGIIEKTAIVIENLNKESAVIGGILNSLDDITGQTNLLSLNASIEAARAGEHGKGFAVVAEEIQKLSVESAKATDNINEIIADIQEEIGTSVRMMEEMKGVSREQGDAVENVKDVFERIKQAADSITDTIREYEKLVESMQANNVEVSGSISNMAAISEETAACTETVATSIIQQSAEISEIAAKAAELKEKIKSLDEEVNKFKIEG